MSCCCTLRQGKLRATASRQGFLRNDPWSCDSFCGGGCNIEIGVGFLCVGNACDYVWAICCVGLLDTLKVRMHVLVTANICQCGKNRFSRSVLRSHPSCLLQDWIIFPKSSDSPGDLHSCKCQSHRMRNRISCCSFIIEASICAYEKWTGKVSLVILASLFIQILIGCSDWLSHFPWFSVGVIDCYWWYPLRPKLISVSLSVSLIPAVYDGPVVTNISCGKRHDVPFAVFIRLLALSVSDTLFIAACELSVKLVLTLMLWYEWGFDDLLRLSSWWFASLLFMSL